MTISLLSLNRENWQQALNLKITSEQQALSEIPPNVRSIAEAYVDRNLEPYLIYPPDCCDPEPKHGPIGFCVLEITDSGIGFLLRLMIDQNHQRQGYGKAAIAEIIRRMKLNPKVQRIAASHRPQNKPMSNLLSKAGFVPWDVSHWSVKAEGEVFVTLPQV